MNQQLIYNEITKSKYLHRIFFFLLLSLLSLLSGANRMSLATSSLILVWVFFIRFFLDEVTVAAVDVVGRKLEAYAAVFAAELGLEEFLLG